MPDLAGVIAIVVTNLLVGIGLAGLILRQGARLDEQGRDIKELIANMAALKATVETFFRLRVDPPQPPVPDQGQHDKAA